MEERKAKRKHRDRDRLSDLPDCVLLHIMNFMDTRYAVQTCVLSKRWNHLWKSLTNLSFTPFPHIRIRSYNKFLYRFLSSHDDSISLLSLHFFLFRSAAPKFLNKVIKHVASRNLQQLTITTDSKFRKIPNSFVPLIFACQSLTFLKLSISSSRSTLELPKSLLLPTLKTLHLANVSFTPSDDHCAEPFSTCNLLNTLVLQDYSLSNDRKVLCISNSNISCLKLDNITNRSKIVLSTPNLTSITIVDNLNLTFQELSSTCNLSFLEQVYIDTRFRIDSSVIISWLQMLSNVKILSLSSYTLNIILKDLSNLITTEIQPPSFVRLESLRMKMGPYIMISDNEVNRIKEYLLENSPLTRVAVIKC